MRPNDSVNAFVPDIDVRLAPTGQGPLSGLRFAAKDLFDIAGRVTGFGNPDWRRTHEPAKRTASAVSALLDAGAEMVGKTITDELAFSLEGRNAHYGTPTNVAAPGRIPGGSSSGSAAAVAAGLVDFALGSDTGGSVRVPAALTGIFGIRPSHGRVDDAGALPLAPSLDTVGWFARDAALLARVGAVLLGADLLAEAPRRALLATDAMAVADPPVAKALAPALAAVARLLGPVEPVAIAETAGEAGVDLIRWKDRFRFIQAREIRRMHGAWIDAVQPKFGPEVAARFAWTATVPEAAAEEGATARERFTAALDGLLAGGAVLCLPTAPMIAPRTDAPTEAFLAYRDRTLTLTCTAGLARLPQVNLPAGRVEAAPIGLSLIGRRGTDRALLDLAVAVAGEMSRKPAAAR